MPRLDLETRKRLLECYYENQERANQNGEKPEKRVLLAYQQRYGGRLICTPLAVKKFVEKFRRIGTVKDAPRSGRSKIDDEIVEEVSDEMIAQSLANPLGNCSTYSVATAVGIPQATAWRIMRKRIGCFPYRLRSMHELKAGDPDKRMNFAAEFLANAEIRPGWLNSILWSDEAIFTLDGQVNRWNCCIWSPDNPHAFVQSPLHSNQINVWIGFTAEFMVGPYFFGEYDEFGVMQPINVNSAAYLRMLEDFVVRDLRRRNALDRVTFQQDSAPAHRANIVSDFLRQHFGENRVISGGFAFPWPPRSPDLAPCDYFLWGYLKDMVYKVRHGTLEALCDDITRCSASITDVQLQNAVYHSIRRAQMVLDHDGGHIEQFL